MTQTSRLDREPCGESRWQAEIVVVGGGCERYLDYMGLSTGFFFGLVLETRLGSGGAFMEEQIFPFLPPVEKPPTECVWKMSGLPCCLFWMPDWGKVQRCQFLFFHHRRFPAVALPLSHPCGG